VRISGSLVTCGRCGKPRGIRHVCVTKATSRRRVTRTRFKPSVSLGKCSKCGRPLGNPLTHTCRVRTDWKQRASAAERSRKAAAARQKQDAWKTAWLARQKAAAARRRAAERARRRAWQDKQREKARSQRAAASKRAASRTHDRDRHEPQACGDDNCPRYGCRIWREAYYEGRRRGHDEGHAEGYSNGYEKGFPDGIAACPLPHQG